MDDYLKNFLDNFQDKYVSYRTFYFSIDILPVPKQSVRFGGHAYPDPKKKKYVNEIIQQLKEQFSCQKIKNFVKLTVIFSLPWTKKDSPELVWVPATGRSDCDNFLKPFLDALQKVCIENDSLIIALQAAKIRSAKIGIFARIEEVYAKRQKSPEVSQLQRVAAIPEKP